MAKNHSDHAGVITTPPAIYMVGLLIGLGIDHFYPLHVVPPHMSFWLGIILIQIALPFALSAVWAFRQAGTPIHVRHPTRTVVTKGIYRLTRNPMYLGLTLFYLGVGFWKNSLWIVLLLIPVLLLMIEGVIKREEKYLAKKFGEEYHRYKSKVRRWM